VCFACRWVARRLGLPLVPVFAVRLCPVPSALYTVLMGYKESPVAEARRRFAVMVWRLLDRFLAAHADCLAAGGGAFDVVLPVPSTARPSGAPLAAVGNLGRAVEERLRGACWLPGVLERAHVPIGHMRPDATAFAVPAPASVFVEGRRALLLDDTYVSGARSQSAAAALRIAGARAVTVLALGRVLRPSRSSLHADFLRRSGAGGIVDPGARSWCRCDQTLERSA
jgi:hypothetical protein